MHYEEFEQMWSSKDMAIEETNHPFDSCSPQLWRSAESNGGRRRAWWQVTRHADQSAKCHHLSRSPAAIPSITITAFTSTTVMSNTHLTLNNSCSIKANRIIIILCHDISRYRKRSIYHRAMTFFTIWHLNPICWTRQHISCFFVLLQIKWISVSFFKLCLKYRDVVVIIYC